MKKNYILSLVIAFLFSGALFAQKFSVLMPDTVGSGDCGYDYSFEGGNFLVNNTDFDIEVNVVRTKNVTTKNWTSMFCLDVCYPSSVNSVLFTLKAHTKQFFVFHIISDTIVGKDKATMRFENTSDQTNVFYTTFSTECVTGINELSYQSKVNLYPMPITSGHNFNLDIANANSKTIALQVFNIYGSIVKTLSVIEGNNTVALDLPVGIYSYNLSSDNTIVNSGRLVISQ